MEDRLMEYIEYFEDINTDDILINNSSGYIERGKNQIKTKGYKLENGFYHGEYLTYFQDGKVSSRRYYKNGILDGDYHGYSGINGNLIHLLRYKDGVIQGNEYYWNSDGTLVYEASYINGKKEGYNREYYNNNQVRIVKFFKEGKLNGEYLNYHWNGQIYIKKFYKNHMLNGKCYKYYENGKLLAEGEFRDDEKIGYIINYSEGGVKVYEKYIYKNIEYSEDERIEYIRDCYKNIYKELYEKTWKPDRYLRWCVPIEYQII